MDVDVVILCGGKGTRLGSITKNLPKPMVEIADGKPFLNFLLERIYKNGFRRFILCAGYLGKVIEKYYKSKEACYFFPEAEFVVVVENRPLGTGGALKNAKPMIKSQEILVTNGDSICAVSFSDMLHFHRKHGQFATMAVTRTVIDSPKDYGTVKIDGNNQIIAFEEKSKKGYNWINAGIYFFSSNILNYFPEGFLSLEHNVLPYLAVKKQIIAYKTKAPLIDIGTPFRLTRAMEILTEGVI